MAMADQTPPIYIIGAGIAGLFAALKLAPHPVVVISPQRVGDGTASGWAQGGIAAALGADDSALQHATDTLATGAGLCDEETVQLMCEEAAQRIDDLLALGVPFDQDADGRLNLGLEAAHSRRRIVHIQGDRAGATIMQTIVGAVRHSPHITLKEGVNALALSTDEAGITGLWMAAETHSPEWLPAHTIILATGGIGALYHVTTNPSGAYGSGVAMAAQAGAELADLEFVQFHPTALAVGLDPAPLATEALRGEGAVLLNAHGHPLMQGQHPLADLAPRDVVARAIHREIASGGTVCLDARHAIGAHFSERFPTVFAACQRAYIDPVTQPIPISPAAHYHIGGVAADHQARSTVDGLYACGEVAATGAHGANRLASNSLLESLVFSARAAMDILVHPRSFKPVTAPASPIQHLGTPDAEVLLTLRRTMLLQVGIERDAEGLNHAMALANRLLSDQHAPHTLRQMALVAQLVAQSALHRQESRGCHFRQDFPDLATPTPPRQRIRCG